VRVAVLGGGRSSEHEISLVSAAAIRAGLQQAGHEPLEVAIATDGRWSANGDAVTIEPSGGLLGELHSIPRSRIRAMKRSSVNHRFPA
jgi:D-alanine-D-alanine ligase